MENVQMNLKNLNHWKTFPELIENLSTCDLRFICKNGKVLAHKIIILHAVPEILSLICNACRDSHEDIVVILPDIEEEFMKYCLQELYTNRDASMLRFVLSFDLSMRFKEEKDESDLGDHYEHKETKPEVVTKDLGKLATGNSDLETDNNECDAEDDENVVQRYTGNEFQDEVKEEAVHVMNVQSMRMHEEKIVTNPELSDLVVGSIFESEPVVKELVKIFNENNLVNMTISSNSNRQLLYQCPCSRTKKSRSQGIRNVVSRFTNCPALIRFSKKVNGSVKLCRFVPTHNHDPRLGFPKKGSSRAFNWDSIADAVLRDGVIGGKSVEEMREAMESEGVDPLPTLKTISRRVKPMRTMLGLDFSPVKVKKDGRGRPPKASLLAGHSGYDSDCRDVAVLWNEQYNTDH